MSVETSLFAPSVQCAKGVAPSAEMAQARSLRPVGVSFGRILSGISNLPSPNTRILHPREPAATGFLIADHPAP